MSDIEENNDEEQLENEGLVDALESKPKRTTNPKNKYYLTNIEDSKAAAADMNLKDAERKLTEFQRKLVHNIVFRSMDRATAAKSAGSTIKDKQSLQRLAYETMLKPHVRAYMDYQIEKKNEIAGVDKVEVIEGLREVIKTCLIEGKYKEALKAYELLGSHLGMWKSVSQSTTIKKNDSSKSALIDDGDEEESEEQKAMKDIGKLLHMVSNNQPPKKKP
jgi:hypothetical protein